MLDTALRDAIEQLVLELLGYGYRRVTKALQRNGWGVNHKQVLRVMRQEALLCQLERRFVVTTDSGHALRTTRTCWPMPPRQTGPGLIHHSDCGVQYASAAYVSQLTAVDAQISMAAVATRTRTRRRELLRDAQTRGGVPQPLLDGP